MNKLLNFEQIVLCWKVLMFPDDSRKSFEIKELIIMSL